MISKNKRVLKSLNIPIVTIIFFKRCQKQSVNQEISLANKAKKRGEVRQRKNKRKLKLILFRSKKNRKNQKIKVLQATKPLHLVKFTCAELAVFLLLLINNQSTTSKNSTEICQKEPYSASARRSYSHISEYPNQKQSSSNPKINIHADVEMRIVAQPLSDTT